LRSDFCPICDWYNSGKRLSENPATLDFTGEFGFSLIIPYGDLSRLGRNYLEVGNLAEVFLPQHGCELISLNEKLDDMMVFRNWFNEQHSKTTGKKVKAARRICAENGKFIAAYAPYGYLRNPENRHALVIDPITAPTIREVFEMRAAGMGYRAIAQKLNDSGVISPKNLYYQRANRTNPNSGNGLWTANTIRAILRNETYIGNLTQCKAAKESYKSTKIIYTPENEWVRATKTHEPIIPQELWERVQSIKNHKPRRTKSGETALFSGLLFCADCNYKLRAHTERRTGKDGGEKKYISYMCANYAANGKTACTCHAVFENPLQRLIFEYINALPSFGCDEQRVAEAIQKARDSAANSHCASLLRELDTCKKQASKLDILIENLYKDKVAEIVPESMFTRQVRKFEAERAERLQTAETLQKRINALTHETANTTDFLPAVTRQLQSLCREMLLLFVEKIIVSESRTANGKRVCDLRVVYHV